MAVAAEGRQLYDAAVGGDVIAFQQLLQQDSHLLDAVSYACSRNLLHIATMRGHETIVNILLNINPQLARDLDSQKWSALHFAAAQGNIRITRKLLTAAPEMCWSLDCQGMNPIHVVAVRGHVEIVRELLQQDYLPASLERAHRGQTVMHLCVKHGQLAVLKVLVEKLGEFVCAMDDDGEMVLHWAIRCKQVEIIRYLVENTEIEEQWTTSKGETVLGILSESPQDASYLPMRDLLVRRLLLLRISGFIFLKKMSNTIMTVMILIASMAFAAIISPPGGVWQDNSSQHRAGQAVMAYNYPGLYKFFIRTNSIAFLLSIFTISLLAAGPTKKNNPFDSLVICCSMMYSLFFIFCSYVASISVLTPRPNIEVTFIIVIFFGCLTTIVLVIPLGKHKSKN